MYDQELSQLINAAISRIDDTLEEAAPFMAGQVSAWMRGLSRRRPEAYFQHPLGFPMLLVPWWLEKAIHRQPDTAFQGDLVYSTINGYYHVRLIDNLMDGHATVELEMLPALSFFHTQFQAAYQRHFGHRHPFWEFFETVWLQSAEVTMRDASLSDVTREQFVEVAAKKTCAAKIPAAAVCYKYERQDLIGPWAQWLDLFGCWHQMWNDLFTWGRDIKNGTCTYFLSEAERSKVAGQSATEWVIKGGFEWGIRQLQDWMGELKDMASSLDSQDLLAYLDGREAMLLERSGQIANGMRSAARLVDALREL